jgi:hypothetical protein
VTAFRIAYRAVQGDAPQARVIDADTVSAAMDKLGLVWSIVRLSRRCAAVTKAGRPCPLWTHDEYCRHHRPRGES